MLGLIADGKGTVRPWAGASVSLTPCFSVTWGTSPRVLRVLEAGGFVKGHKLKWHKHKVNNGRQKRTKAPLQAERQFLSSRSHTPLCRLSSFSTGGSLSFLILPTRNLRSE